MQGAHGRSLIETGGGMASQSLFRIINIYVYNLLISAGNMKARRWGEDRIV